MLCERCFKNQSSVSLAKIINGDRIELHYCGDCARIVSEVDFDTPFSSSNFLESILDNINKSPLKVNYILMTACSRCGMTYNQYKEIGRLGCPECYKSFSEKLGPIILGRQGAEFHTGKRPEGVTEGLGRIRELQNLKNELQKAVGLEAFEEAAEIRDRIKHLEQQVDPAVKTKEAEIGEVGL